MCDRSWIQTFTGVQMFPLKPLPEQICIEDVAHALSQICRFTGQSCRFYSVGEHSVRVSTLLANTDGNTAARYGLLHDASEAYMADVSAPLKAQAIFKGYRKAEAYLQGIIYIKYGLNPLPPPCLQTADLRLLNTERKALLGKEPASWGKLPSPLRGCADDMGWPPRLAERLFLDAFKELFLGQQ